MKIRGYPGWFAVVLWVGVQGSTARGADKVTYQGAVRPILKARCFKCHSDEEQKADLNLEHYATLLKGGSGGPAVVAGKPNSSLLFQSVIHAEGVEKMPPKSEQIPAAEIELIRRWIAGGVPEEDASVVRTVALLDPGRIGEGRPANPVMPEGLPVEALPVRAHPVTALAASPWAPLVAQAQRDFIVLRAPTDGRVLGNLPFPEGIPFVLRFSRDGARLLAAGGNPVQSGRAVLLDVRSGRRLGEFGDEHDAVLAADLSPDGQLVALGGSGRVVKVFSGSDGAQKYRLAKHTDWIIAVAFSPDGRYVVTGDRAGGIHMWEAATGGIALSLSEHKDAITALEWRADSRLLASASEDGAVIVWDAKDGWPAATLSGAHAFAGGKKGRAGVTALAWLSDGRLATAGRDRRVRLWEGGGALVGAWDALDSLPTRLSALDGGGELFVGDDAGGLHRLETRDGKMRLQTIGR